MGSPIKLCIPNLSLRVWALLRRSTYYDVELLVHYFILGMHFLISYLLR